MKKLLQVLFLLLVSVNLVFSQTTTEGFEDESAGSTSFTNSSETFTISSSGGATFKIYDSAGDGGGWGANSTDNYIDNYNSKTKGAVLTITSSSSYFYMNNIYIWPDQLYNGTGTVTIKGKLNSTDKFTHVYNVDNDTKGGWFSVDLTTYNSYLINELEFTCTGDVDYLAIDEFEYEIGVAPVELTTFTAALIEEGVKLNWETATEVNNYGFEVERSSFQTDGTTPVRTEWETIIFVEGHGNSNSPKSYEYIDTDVPGGAIEYRLKQIDTDGGYEYYSITAKVEIQVTDVDDPLVDGGLPTEFALEQNYPNPFNPTTVINYSIPVVETFGKTSLHTTLIVYDLLGREVATLVNKQQAAGNYSVNFDASNLSSGMYIYIITAGNFVQSRKMLLLR